MTDENGNGAAGEEQPLTAPVVPVLAVQREALTFITDGGVFHLKLDDILKGAAEGQGPIGMLLYAIVLQLHAVDTSIRRAIDRGETQAASVSEIARDPGRFVDELLEKFTNFAKNGPGTPPGVQS